MCCVMTVPAFCAGAKIQNATVLFRRIWPEKFAVGLKCHVATEGCRTYFAPSCRHVKNCNLRFQERRTKREVMVPRDRAIDGRQIHGSLFTINDWAIAIERESTLQ